MIMDLHFQVPHLAKKLTWFNELENHFIFQFSDDGAHENQSANNVVGKHDIVEPWRPCKK